jgi:hypothetical protein
MKFNQRLYDECDQYAKDRIKAYLENRGHTIIKELEDFMHDLTTKKGDEIFQFELETKTGRPFTGRDDFPFLSASFLGRKERLHRAAPFWYLILCYETGAVVCCHSSIIYQEQYKQTISLKTKLRQHDDIMYRVPIHLCKFFKT